MQAKSTKNNARKSKRPKRTVKRIRKTLKLPNNRTKRANVIRGKKIAAASALTMRKKFTVLRQQGNSVRVTGRDLIYPIPDSLVAPMQSTNVIAVIPANPVYWTGTRIAALASGYQNYRPIKFKVNYIPICAVTQQGNVIGGTIWDDGIANDSIQQSLRTSNGGFLTQCYTPHSTSIRPKSNLPFNLYKIGGDFQQTNPFIFIAIAIGCTNTNDQRIIPGYFYVTWSFELKNPIGSTNQFYNTGLINYSQLQPRMNNTIINLVTNSEVPFGAYINVEIENSTLVPYYNETPITVAQDTPTWGFQSISKATNTTITTKIPINYTALTTNRTLDLEATDTGTKATYTVFDPVAYLIDSGEKYTIWEPETATRSTSAPATAQFTWQAPTQADIYYMLAPDQMLGTFKNTGVATIQGTSYTGVMTYNIYEASKQYFMIQLANTSKPQQKEAKFIHFAQTNQTIKATPPPLKDNQIEDEKIEEDNIIRNYLDQEDIHNEKDLDELENRIKLLRIKNNKNQQ
jgi:hypothetical protein